MTISTSKQGVWVLDDTYKRVASGFWAYDDGSDPGVTSLWYWGSTLADNTAIAQSSPVLFPGCWCRFSEGAGFAIKTDNTLWGWGGNSQGRLGDQTQINRSSPIQIPGTTWNKVSSNSNGTTLAIKTDGTLWSWGYGTQGQLGQSDAIHRSSPVQIPGTQWCHISALYRASSALKTNGTLWVWGFSGGTQGQLGISSGESVSSPVQVPGTAWVDISFSNSVVARKTDGTIWTWGNNYFGTLGIDVAGGGTYRTSPVQVPGSTWTDASAGSSSSGRHMLATKNDGTLWTWGRNNYGQLGISTETHRSSPVQIPGTQWSITTTGGSHSLAIKTDGTLWTWGHGEGGRLGINTTNDRSSPIQVPGTSWSNVYKSHLNTTVAKKTNP